MRSRVILGVVLLVATASLAVAQITSATISGTIKDETGGVLPGVDVVVSNVDTGLTRSVVTDSNGYFTVPGLPPGKYETRASLQGFRTGLQTGVALEVAQQAGLNMILKVGTAAETITVTGESADGSKVSHQTCGVDGREFVQTQGRLRFQIGGTEFRQSGIEEKIGRDRLARNDRRDVSDQNFRNRTD